MKLLPTYEIPKHIQPLWRIAAITLSLTASLFSPDSESKENFTGNVFSFSLSLFFFFSPLSVRLLPVLTRLHCAAVIGCSLFHNFLKKHKHTEQSAERVSAVAEKKCSYSKVNICFWHLDSSLNAHVAPARIVRNVHGENRKLKVSGSTQTWERDDVSQPQQRVKYGQWVPTTVSGRVMSKCVHRWVRTSKETHITLRIRLVFFTH